MELANSKHLGYVVAPPNMLQPNRREAKRLIMEEDLHEVPALATVQALALMSGREAGCDAGTCAE